jgi:hypothetical protein
MDKKESLKFKNPLNQLTPILIMCLTLGLAPFVPEPHLWGKLKWIAGGAVGMKTLDWFDLIFHGLPWILLVRIIIISVRAKLKTRFA